jgi:MOSC domain-containing protein YiiM
MPTNKAGLSARLLGLYGLKPGQQLRLGSAVIVLTHLCPPCKHVDEVRPGLQQELAGRRGMLARVLQTGDLRVGDAVEVLGVGAAD